MTNAFLNVTDSFLQRRWETRPYDERQALALSQRFSLPDLIARTLSARGYDLETVDRFLDPKLRDLLPDPSSLKDMDKAVNRFVQAVETGDKIAVFGDFDVDGATSSAVLIRFARSLGIDLRLYIPDRVEEGYGPNSEAMKKLAEEGNRLVVCVDCGITAHEPLVVARDLGLDVIIIDHHAAEPQIPPCIAAVNPNRLDDPMGATLGSLAAVGVTFLFVIAVNRALRVNGFYHEERTEPNLMQWLDLVALGTICDIVSLTGLNRAFVTQGLKVMEHGGNKGIAALAEVSGAKKEMDTYTAGFLLGPRINAGGRVGRADMGARLLVMEDESELVGYAQRLNDWNHERRALEAEVLAEAELVLFDEASPISFVASENWHPGVIGIVASRLKDKFQRPAIVVSLTNGIGKGSGRSIGTIDLGAAVIAARQAGLLLNGGGHKMAAGLTVDRKKINELREFLMERIGKQLEAEPFVPTLFVDGLISIAAANLEFLEKLNALAPYGTGNPEPRFAFADCRIARTQVVGENHVKVILQQGASRLDAIAFRAMNTHLGPALLARSGQQVHIAGKLRRNVWQGREAVQLIVDDAAGI